MLFGVQVALLVRAILSQLEFKVMQLCISLEIPVMQKFGGAAKHCMKLCTHTSLLVSYGKCGNKTYPNLCDVPETCVQLMVKGQWRI